MVATYVVRAVIWPVGGKEMNGDDRQLEERDAFWDNGIFM